LDAHKVGNLRSLRLVYLSLIYPQEGHDAMILTEFNINLSAESAHPYVPVGLEKQVSS
jgi:hypothetical protein